MGVNFAWRLPYHEALGATSYTCDHERVVRVWDKVKGCLRHGESGTRRQKNCLMT